MSERQPWQQARRRRRSAGQAIVEFALILPLLLTLTVGLVDAARALWAYTALQNVAAEGSRATIALLFPTTQAPDPCLVGGSAGNTQGIVDSAIAEASVLGFDASPLSGAGVPLTNNSFSLAGYDAAGSANLCNVRSVTFTATYTFQPLVSEVFGLGAITMHGQSTMLVE